MGRRPNGASSIYLGADGDWHGRVTVGIKDDGKPDRRHVQAKTEAAVIRRVRALEKERDSGRVRKAGQRWTVDKWLTHWIENIAVPPAISGYTHDGYKVDISHYLIPGIGAHKLDKLTPEHLERLYAKMLSQGKAAGTAHHVHRTIRAALNEAIRRGHLTMNPAMLAKAPSPDEHEVEPYEVDEIKRILKVASERRNSTRWAIALALGLRQGEALGLRWIDVDLTGAVLRVRRSRLRPKYAHGCGETCGKTPGYCPQRVQVNRDTKDTKSRAGKRVIGLPREIVALLRAHKDRQDAERVAAGDLWCDEGWVFAMPDGRALSPNTDYREWKALLKAAGVNDGRLHDARHTSATVLLLLGVPERTVMAVMGWSSTSMAARYQHVTDTIRRQVADRVDGLIWPADSEPKSGDVAGRTDHK
ncbi:site-specific integrase [Phytoactinopolyspora alkaliphila]|uniref:Site-specific integrase n=1 Tax=Phytoactinopolyspora alkaliphila TaxID=1783498 RepID=A0A6N9YLK7_9ACTN|nr:site-specific integrase [Phytoactinopolyspora alkaliphila]NED95845.1 site-specific integrase [Phytoactinopolyspora alkaliphila]